MLCDGQKFNVVCVTESQFLSDNADSQRAIIGYRCIRGDKNRHGGGVALYVRNDLEVKVLLQGPLTDYMG